MLSRQFTTVPNTSKVRALTSDSAIIQVPYRWSSRVDGQHYALPALCVASSMRCQLYALPALCVDRGEFLDPHAVADAGGQLFRIVDDADRVLVGGRPATHVRFAIDRRREIVDQELDLVVVGIL